MKHNVERDQKICRLFLSGKKRIRDLGKQFKVSEVRVQQILQENGITPKREREKQCAILASQIEEFIRQKPELTTSQIATKLDIGTSAVLRLIKKFKIKRNKLLICSKSQIERLRNGRVPLTYELLYQKRIIERKTQTDIAEELGYTQAYISLNLKRFGIKPKSKSEQAE